MHHLSPIVAFVSVFLAGCGAEPGVAPETPASKPEAPASKPEAPPGLPTLVVTDGVAIAAYDGFTVADKEDPAPFTMKRCKTTPLTPDDHKRMLELGAKRVRVKVPQLGTPLYGVLALCAMSSSARGPGSRSHRIQIPDEYVVATEGGRIAVVFEEVEDVAEKAPFTSWQLYLSRSAFPGESADERDKAEGAAKKALDASEATGKAHVLPPKKEEAKAEEPKKDETEKKVATEKKDEKKVEKKPAKKKATQ